jgi:hypothetical protein
MMEMDGGAAPTRMSPEELQEFLSSIFIEADQDNSGTLSYSEFKEVPCPRSPPLATRPSLSLPVTPLVRVAERRWVVRAGDPDLAIGVQQAGDPQDADGGRRERRKCQGYPGGRAGRKEGEGGWAGGLGFGGDATRSLTLTLCDSRCI